MKDTTHTIQLFPLSFIIAFLIVLIIFGRFRGKKLNFKWLKHLLKCRTFLQDLPCETRYFYIEILTYFCIEKKVRNLRDLL